MEGVLSGHCGDNNDLSLDSNGKNYFTVGREGVSDYQRLGLRRGLGLKEARLV